MLIEHSERKGERGREQEVVSIYHCLAGFASIFLFHLDPPRPTAPEPLAHPILTAIFCAVILSLIFHSFLALIIYQEWNRNCDFAIAPLCKKRNLPFYLGFKIKKKKREIRHVACVKNSKKKKKRKRNPQMLFRIKENCLARQS